MKITYLGHSCFYIETQNSKIVIDPFFDKDKFEISPTHVVVTHGHSDHLGHAEELCKNGAKFISTFEICNYMASKGFEEVSRMHIGGFVNFGDFKIKFVPATHSSSIDGINLVGVSAGVIIKNENKMLYHLGDTGLSAEMDIIGRFYKIDMALMPIGGNFTMDVEDALHAVELIKPKHVVPMHYNTFPVVEQDPEEFIKKLPDTTKGIILEIGQSTAL